MLPQQQPEGMLSKINCQALALHLRPETHLNPGQETARRGRCCCHVTHHISCKLHITQLNVHNTRPYHTRASRDTECA